MTTALESEVGNTGMRRTLFLLAAGLQIGCGVIFTSDVIAEWPFITPHTWVEAAGVVALGIGAGLSLREYRNLLRRNKRVERALNTASGGFQQSIEAHFNEWNLTEAERDVALLTIKGMRIDEIARLRNTAEGTIKAQNASIYRKAGVGSRAEMISAVIEDLITGIDISGSRPLNGPANSEFRTLRHAGN